MLVYQRVFEVFSLELEHGRWFKHQDKRIDLTMVA
jgi:hypothetical protein